MIVSNDQKERAGRRAPSERDGARIAREQSPKISHWDPRYCADGIAFGHMRAGIWCGPRKARRHRDRVTMQRLRKGKEQGESLRLGLEHRAGQDGMLASEGARPTDGRPPNAIRRGI